MSEKKKITIKDSGFAIPQENYKLMLIGFGIVTIGFLLMLGGGSSDPKVFDTDMFSARRIIVAPIVVLLGFGFELWAIMRKPNE